MKPLRLSVGVVALGLITLTASPAEAAWNNVFQVTCWNCRPKSVSSYYLAPAPVYAYASPACSTCGDACGPQCPQPCPQQCTTKYVQRCYYQPVTTYTTQSYYEAVTTYQTRTYYEPVTTYRYSCYYDPCSCSYQQVATPCTSYVQRCQSCPVQSWVQRCAQVPVTSYQKAFYWEPQTTCCAPPAPACCTSSSGGPVVQQQPIVQDNIQPQQPPQQPNVDEKSGPGPGPGPGGPGGPGSQMFDKYYNKEVQPNNNEPPTQSRQVAPNGKTMVPIKTNPTLPPSVKLERIAQADGMSINGQVVSDKNAPKAGAKLIFVSAKRQSPEKTTTANASGRFQVELSPGAWLIYVRTADGQQVYHSRIEIASKQQAPIVLVSR